MTKIFNSNLKKMTKMFSMLLLAICMITFFNPTKVEAAAAPRFYLQKMNIFKYPARPIGSWNQGFDIQNMQKKDKVTRCTSSNPKVLSVEAVKDEEGYYYISVDPRKAGTVTLKCNIKRGKKTYKISTKVRVIKYKTPLSKFSIGKNSVLSTLKKDGHHNFENDTFKGKLSIKAASGWKITGIWLENYENGKNKKIKNGATITLDGKKWNHIRIDTKNIKEKYENTVGIMVNPR